MRTAGTGQPASPLDPPPAAMIDRRDSHLANALATAMLAGPWVAAELSNRAAVAVGRRQAPKWISRLSEQVVAIHPRPPRDAPRELVQLLLALPAWKSGERNRRHLRAVSWSPALTEMGRARWPVTPLGDLAALARLLDVTIAELEWFADVRRLEREAETSLRHYRTVVRRKPGGVRVIEIPKPRLREIQRRLLRHVLNPIALHPTAHGCVPGSSVATALAPHEGSAIVLRCDLESFFASVSPGRVWGVLRNAGYPEAVAHTIAGLTTTSMARRDWESVVPPVHPNDLDRHRRLGRWLASPHLPQGAPTSPALANLVGFTLDRRLAGLSSALGLHYTRYVDDLIFSGPGLRPAKLARAIGQIAVEEGFRLASPKTIAIPSSRRQQFLGAVVNAKVGPGRRELDQLRAIVHNCVSHGWAGQARGRPRDEFRAHLTGRIAWVNGLDPRRGEQLRLRASAIKWSEE
jgi:RNA-directed DNA polymerase